MFSIKPKKESQSNPAMNYLNISFKFIQEKKPKFRRKFKHQTQKRITE
ncbi:hypothetical protein FSS13T_21130 [Flavobacterium saliperosum S13]|uniref:Uncharacterized protein n=1 Tax=Flavobacterium saliperosum S13 TaxID=1341155 RepID=A0ABN0QF47_9FLAO|nr:hypothetical protein FSS13T_21130 [Flavobacterium saliperosum S13]